MKAEVSINARVTMAEANLVGGFSPRMPDVALFPVDENSLAYPMQKDCNTQGQVSSLYYAYSKDLKNSGASHAIGTTIGFPTTDQGMIQFKGQTDGAAGPGNANIIGSIKFTWYCRFHGRTRAIG